MAATSKTVYTPEAPKPIGPYSQAVVSGGFVFCSGQLGLDPITGEMPGRTAAEQAERALMNLRAVLIRAGSDVSHVVKVTIFLKNIKDFDEVNRVYTKFFDDNKPARSAVEVSELPRGALVEIEAVAEVR
ncbi:MAG: RidA family protein [Thermoplasmata archaeon]|jgi:2-iminobutanoate/2-iminopropanoate deaminase|nr:RidA family protein [Thermoplasmata archaeon]